MRQYVSSCELYLSPPSLTVCNSGQNKQKGVVCVFICHQDSDSMVTINIMLNDKYFLQELENVKSITAVPIMILIIIEYLHETIHVVTSKLKYGSTPTFEGNIVNVGNDMIILWYKCFHIYSQIEML